MSAQQYFTARALAGLPGMPETRQRVKSKGAREGWASQPYAGKGGGLEYSIACLPPETQAALLLKYPPATPAIEPTTRPDDADVLWQRFNVLPEKTKQQAADRLTAVNTALTMISNGVPRMQAWALVGRGLGVSEDTIYGWYTAANAYPPADWLAVLAPRYVGRTVMAPCDSRAWDWFCGAFLTRDQANLKETYRRLVDIAAREGWIIPSERTLERRMAREISVATKVFLREGAEALNRLHPSMQRDKRCFRAGEAVSGDGLKFDRLWVNWGDEIINTSTGWFWQDIYSGKILAHRLAKTENTDVFRLATYDLTAICLPSYVQIDNTTVAANKAMTGGASHRHRFGHQPDDPHGILLQLGMEPHFTNPDMTISNPGVKPIERAFGIGGLHEKAATSPRLLGRAYSKATALPVDEFRAIVAEEVARHNAQTGRRSPVCSGRSFDETFAENFATSVVRKATDAQRRLLLLMPEKVHASTARGDIGLKAGRGPAGQHRYWHEALARHAGKWLVAYYDPENLSLPVSVYGLDGRFIVYAERTMRGAFNDTAVAREYGKNTQRLLKSQKATANAQRRMSALERAALYQPHDDVEIPPPGVVQGNFQQKRLVVNGEVIDRATGQVVPQSEEVPEHETHFNRAVAQALEFKKRQMI